MTCDGEKREREKTAGAGTGRYPAAVGNAELYLAEAAAKRVIDSLDGLYALRKETVAETAQSEIVQDLLCRSMIEYVMNLPRYKQGLYAHLCRRETFGIGGGCRVVAPVFAHLLNRIHGGTVARSVQLHDHAAVLTKSASGKLQYLDATWRQGEDKRLHQCAMATDPRERLPMVRVSEKKPTLGSLDEAVTEALVQKLASSDPGGRG